MLSGVGGIYHSVSAQDYCCLCCGEASRAWLVMDYSGTLVGSVKSQYARLFDELVLGHSSPVVELDVRLCNNQFAMHTSVVTCRALERSADWLERAYLSKKRKFGRYIVFEAFGAPNTLQAE